MKKKLEALATLSLHPKWLELLVAASLRRGIVSESLTVPTSFYCLPALDSFVLQV